MKDIKYPVYGDVDDLIFVGETWSHISMGSCMTH